MANTTTQKKPASEKPEPTKVAPKAVTSVKPNGVKKPDADADPYERFRTLDPQTWNRIVSFSKEAERELDDIVAEIHETAEADYLSQHPEKDRPLWALRIVASRITVEGLTSADQYLLLVLDFEQPQVVKTKNGPKNVATIRGIASKYDESGEAGEASFAEVAFWEEEADKVNDAEVGQAYDIKLAGSYKDGRFQLKSTPKTNWSRKTTLDAKPLDLLKELYEKVDLADIVEAAKQKKPFLFNAQVTFSRSGKGASGKQYGLITIYDETQDVSERGISVFTSPHHAVYGTGSRLWILGTVAPGKKNPETGDNYAPSINALAIVPEFVIPMAFSKQTTIEAKTIKDDDEAEAVDFSTFKKKAEESSGEESVDESSEEEPEEESGDEEE